MKKILVWGVGKIASILLKNGLSGEVIGFIETFKKTDTFQGEKVYRYTEIPKPYDAIVVANTHSNEIYLSAQREEMNLEKMIFLTPCAYVNPRKNLEWIKEILGKNNFEMYLGTYGFYDETFFASDMQRYKVLNRRKNFEINEDILWPVIKDKFENAGIVNNYFWQDLWAARLVFDNRPKVHYDIGSRLDGFIAHVLAYKIPVRMIDIRPFPVKISGLDTIVDDATEMHQFEDDSIDSLSALCSLEHFGLGRYGDSIDPEACFKCFSAIQKKLKMGGHLYLAVPVGRERVEFNAHRVFYADTIVHHFSGLKLEEYSCATQGGIECNVGIHKYDNDIHHGDWRYGLFHFSKYK